ncbi:MAG: hypothetical protein RL033_5918 [Pseudomonadota bacterium]|jgi:hypothetical protein
MRETGEQEVTVNSTEQWTLSDGTPMTLRPVVAQDVLQLGRLVESLSTRDRRWRFHGHVKGLTAQRLHATTYPEAKSLALLAIAHLPTADEVVAEACRVVDATGTGAEVDRWWLPDGDGAVLRNGVWPRSSVPRLISG